MAKPDHKSLVQQQFGRSADKYATSDVHAVGESLQVLLDLVQPQSHWRALDVATGAGHTALAFAPFVEQIVATDITEQMLAETNALAQRKQVSNLKSEIADAESLPFEDDSLDLVLCRLAFHHFQKQEQVLAEFARILKPNGILGFTDNFTVTDPTAADFYNRFEKIRDPSHHRVHSLDRLRELFAAANFEIRQTQELTKEFEFHQWADRQQVSSADKTRLLTMLKDTPAPLLPMLKPRFDETTSYFSLGEVVVVAKFIPKSPIS